MSRLAVRGVAKRFGQTVALASASFSVGVGEVVALLGPNGSGKTTLLECVAGLLPMDGGEVRASDGVLSDSSRAELIFYLPDGIAPWRDQPADWVRWFAGELFGSDATAMPDVLQTLRIEELGAQPVGTLSKGQRKRLLLAIALLSTRPVVILDEPFDGLDLRLTRATIALFRRLAARGRSLVLSIHAMADAERVADRLVLLSDGRTIGDGTLEQLRAVTSLPNASLEELFLALS